MSKAVAERPGVICRLVGESVGTMPLDEGETPDVRATDPVSPRLPTVTVATWTVEAQTGLAVCARTIVTPEVSVTESEAE